MQTELPLTSIMTRDVTTVQRNQRPSTVRAIFAEGGFHHLPVLHDRRLVGIISASDLLKIDFSIYGVGEGVLDATLDRELTVADLMQTEPVTVTLETSIREAAQKLSSGAFHSLPIVNDANELVGIVTSTDLIRILLDSYEPAI